MARERGWAIVLLAVALVCCPLPRPLPQPNTWHGGTVYHNTLDLLSTPQLSEEAPCEFAVGEAEYLSIHYSLADSNPNPRIFWRDQPKLMPNLPVWLAFFLNPYQFGSKYRKGAPLRC